LWQDVSIKIDHLQVVSVNHIKVVHTVVLAGFNNRDISLTVKQIHVVL